MNQGEREAERAAIDLALGELPPIEPPPHVVQRTLRAVAEHAGRRQRTRRVGMMMLAIAVVLLSVGLSLLVRRDASVTDASTLAYGPTGGAKNDDRGGQAGQSEARLRGIEDDKAKAKKQQPDDDGRFAHGTRSGSELPAAGDRLDDDRQRGPEIVNGLVEEAGEAAADQNTAASPDLANGDGTVTLRRSGWFDDGEDHRAVALPPGSTSTIQELELAEKGVADGVTTPSNQGTFDPQTGEVTSGFGRDTMSGKGELANANQEIGDQPARGFDSGLDIAAEVTKTGADETREPLEHDGKKREQLAAFDGEKDQWAPDNDGDGVADPYGVKGDVDATSVEQLDWLGGKGGELAKPDEAASAKRPDAENGRRDSITAGLFSTTIVRGEVDPSQPITTQDAEERTLDQSERTTKSAGRGEATLRPPQGFIPAHGYFANTYVPGDSDVAQLDLSRVAQHVAGDVAALGAARGVDQPFDRPVGQALSLQVSADRTAVSGPTRVTLQVGLAGAAPVKTRRAPLGVTLVIDVASARDDAERRTLWSIAERFVAERQPGDAFALLVPGRTGPTVLEGANLSAAEVGRVLAAAAEQPAALDARAIQSAYDRVRAASTVTAPRGVTSLGASTVVVATAQPLGSDLMQGLGNRAHAEALGDIQLSVIGAGARVDRTALATLAQQGQGRRWLAASADDARRVIGDELASAGRTVARALRLRIRLAPGVKLVGVLGSHPLVASDQARVKEAERAIDRKLADVTGIASDRGQDEDGIQIVIPAFVAGDDHAILLDVVVPGPGPVLEVHARWKDLVRMDNAEAQASLSLPNGVDQASPLALNVVENQAALIASEALFEAARHVAHNDAAGAQPRLSIARQELDVLSRRTRAVLDEAQLIARYQALLLDAPKWIEDEDARGEIVRALESTGRTLR